MKVTICGSNILNIIRDSLTLPRCTYESHTENSFPKFLAGTIQDVKGVTPEFAEIVLCTDLIRSAFNV